MNIYAIVFTGIIMCMIQISVFRICPITLKKLFAAVPVLGFMVNMGGSALILAFTGAASMVGIGNMLASVIFGVYLLAYRAAHKCRIDGSQNIVKFKSRVWRFIFGWVNLIKIPKITCENMDKNVYLVF